MVRSGLGAKRLGQRDSRVAGEVGDGGGDGDDGAVGDRGVGGHPGVEPASPAHA